MHLRNIAVVTGGDSSEYVVSLKSGANVFTAIDRNLFNPWLVFIKDGKWVVLDGDITIAEIDRANFSFLFNGEKIILDLPPPA